MFTNTVEILAQKAGARGLQDRYGRPLFAVVAPATSELYKEVQSINPDILFSSIQNALTALPDGSITDQIPTTIYVAPGTYSISATDRVIVPSTQSGLRIYAEKGAILSASASLGSANNGVLELEGRNIVVDGYLEITSGVTPQVGSAITIGGSLETEGDGQGCIVKNVVINGSETSNDFQTGILLRGVSDVVLEDVVAYANQGTSNEIIRVIQADDGVSYTRDGNRLKLINCKAVANNDTSNAVIPLTIADDSHPNTIIDGGVYATDGSGKAIVITSEDCVLTGGGLAASSAAPASGGIVDLVTATGITIGEFYYKDNDATDAAALVDQTNL
jgi:hypothetical protein